MCGIAGFSIAPDDYGKINTEAMTYVLGYEMQSRGKDATGILTVDPKGRFKLRKKPIPADVFLAGKAGIGCSASTLLLHTRAATQGKASNNGNNHPIQYGNVIGIHNGVIWNDDKLFAHYQWKRNNEVDSEAIFAALNNLPQEEALTNIDGGWAIAWVNTDDDPRKLWLARGYQSPLHYACTINGSVVFASTETGVKEAFKYGNISGEPNVQTAKEGFLAHTNPDGGLTVLPEFDGSGDKAIGGRPTKTYISTGYSHGGGWHSAGWEDYNPYSHKDDSKLPTAFTRIPIIGDSHNPKVGDRRKFVDNVGKWHYEECSCISPVLWVRVPEHRLNTPEPTSQREAVVLPFDRMGGEVGRIPDETVVDADTGRYGFAAIGDLICIPVRAYGSIVGNQYGGIIGIVTDKDEFTEELQVEWRPGRLNKWDDYEILIRANDNNERSEQLT